MWTRIDNWSDYDNLTQRVEPEPTIPIENISLKCGWELNTQKTWGDWQTERLQWGSFKLIDAKATSEIDTVTNSLVERAHKVTFIGKQSFDLKGVLREFGKVNFIGRGFVNFFATASDGGYYDRMKNYLPWYEKDDEVFLTILEAYDYELRNVELNRNFLYSNLFTESMTVEVLELWERDFGIKVDPTWSLSERQEMVRARWIYQFGQLTLEKLREIISTFTNAECELHLDYTTAMMEVDFVGTIGKPHNIEGINELLHVVMPGVWTWEFKIHYTGWDEITTEKDGRRYVWGDLRPYLWEEVRSWDSYREKVAI